MTQCQWMLLFPNNKQAFCYCRSNHKLSPTASSLALKRAGLFTFGHPGKPLVFLNGGKPLKMDENYFRTLYWPKIDTQNEHQAENTFSYSPKGKV